MKDIAYLSFTARGAALAETLAAATGGTVTNARREAGFSLRDWTAERFGACEALVIIGAAGIAVRAVAPFLRSKTTDPAVLVLDEQGRFVIPLLSGHLGGANALAQRVAALCGATAVITTATDGRGLFAVDLWAKKQGLQLVQPERIKTVSSKLLAGETVGVYSAFPIRGELPQGLCLCAEREADVCVDFLPRSETALWLLPKTLVLGLGCKRGTEKDVLEAVFTAFQKETGCRAETLIAAASIDRKAGEPGLLAFCEAHRYPLRFFSADELQAAAGCFTASPFVERTVGVDNVCERSAVLASNGELLAKKYARDGVTMALAASIPALDWSW